MSRLRYHWWPYVKEMIRRYPEMREECQDLHSQSVTASYSDEPRSVAVNRTAEIVAIRELPHKKQREYEAVRRAIETTERYRTGQDRLKIIWLVLWDLSHTLEGAALMVPCGIETAWRYHGEFVRMVAGYYGSLD